MVRSRSLASLICAVTLVVALGVLAFSSVPRAYAGDGLYAAQAAGKTRITIDGKAYTSAAHGKGKSGTWDWDGQKKLTLTSFTGDSIMASGSLSVTVNGNVSLKYLGLEPILKAVKGHGVTATGDYHSGDIAISGKGKLVLSGGKTSDELERLDVDYVKDPNPVHSAAGGGKSVMHWRNYTINAANVTIKNCNWYGQDVTISNGSTVVSNGLYGTNVTISNGSTVVTKSDLRASRKLTILDSAVKSHPEMYHCSGGSNVVIKRSTVHVKGPASGGNLWFAMEGDTIAITDSTVSVIGGSSGLRADKLFQVRNSDVTIRGRGLGVDGGIASEPSYRWGQPFAVFAAKIKLEDEGGASIVKLGSSWYLLQSKGYPNGYPEDTVVMKALRNVANGKLSLSKARYTYDGKAKKPGVTVKIGSKKLKKGTNYTVAYKDNKNAGKATVTVKGKGSYRGTLSKTFKIAKVANPMKVAGKKAAVKHKKKASRVKATKAYKFKRKAVGKVTYSRVKKGSSKWLPKVNAKTGAITVKKGAPKGKTLKVRVKVTAKGNGNYKSASKTVAVKVRVK